MAACATAASQDSWGRVRTPRVPQLPTPVVKSMIWSHCPSEAFSGLGVTCDVATRAVCCVKVGVGGREGRVGRDWRGRDWSGSGQVGGDQDGRGPRRGVGSHGEVGSRGEVGCHGEWWGPRRVRRGVAISHHFVVCDASVVLRQGHLGTRSMCVREARRLADGVLGWGACGVEAVPSARWTGSRSCPSPLQSSRDGDPAYERRGHARGGRCSARA